jgi:uncharacterized protein YndB with AHSA1/START domain
MTDTKIQLRIRKPAEDCYEAFVDPAITSKFWFSEGSDRLDAAEIVTWTWGMYGMSSKVLVKELAPVTRILVDWDYGTEDVKTIEWAFTDRGDGSTLVEIIQHNVSGDIAKITDLSSGFAFVLASAKAWLEHSVRLRIVEDVHPDAHVEGWIET